MSQQNNNNMAQALVPKRNGGGNTLLDNIKFKGKDPLFSGVSKTQKFSKKVGKNYKQNSGGRREQSFSKNPKKTQLANEKTLAVSNCKEDLLAPQSLLNFEYAPLRSYQASSNHHHSVKFRKSVTYNKEAFLQANCHFVVDDSQKEKYLVNTVDPDVLVDWEHILLVYLPTHQTPECPICLYPPKAAKMTRCGHVFCWSCILHYLKLDDKSWRKCPICHEAVHEKDLKSVILFERKKFARLENITMKLMKRSKNSLIALPADQWDVEKIDIQTWNDNSFNSSSKLMLGSSNAIVEHILMKEKDVLEAQLAEEIIDKSGNECFTNMALDKVKSQIEFYSCNRNEFITEKSAKEEKPRHIYGNESNLASLLAEQQIESDGEYAFTDDEEEQSPEENPLSLKSEDLEVEYSELCNVKEETVDEQKTRKDISTNLNITGRHRDFSESASSETSSCSHTITTPKRKSDSYYFYQAEDGQNIFLHSLNARCIIEEYGGLEQGPLQISGQIIDFECMTMTKELRKRYRYLRHLPISCEFIVCELMLRPPVLSRSTIKYFMPEFKKRKASRLKKIEEQRKFDRRASAARSRQEGYRVEFHYDDYEENAVKIDLNDDTDFPSNILSPENKHVTKEAKIAGPSFAQVMKDDSHPALPKKQTQAWNVQTPARNIKEELTNSMVPRLTSIDDEDCGPDIVAPSFQEMFSTAMFTTPLDINNKNNEKKTSGKKKKNNKGMLLFATGAQRKY